MRKFRTRVMTENEAEEFFQRYSATITMCGVHHYIGDEYRYYYYEE